MRLNRPIRIGQSRSINFQAAFATNAILAVHTQVPKVLRLVEDILGHMDALIHVKGISQQSVFFHGGQRAQWRRIRGEHSCSAGKRVKDGPGENKWHGPTTIDVQVVQGELASEHEGAAEAVFSNKTVGGMVKLCRIVRME
jgi:hypothetical protein